MSGKLGQRSALSTALPTRYRENLLDELDGRCKVARAVKGRYRRLVASLGGEEVQSYQLRSLCWRFVCLEAFVEEKERGLLEGREIDEDRYLSSLNSYAGLLNRLGLGRRPKPAPTIQDYLAAKQSTQDEVQQSYEVATPDAGGA